MPNNEIRRVWVQGEPVRLDVLRGMMYTEENGAHTFKITGRDSQGASIPLSGTVLCKFTRSDNYTIAVSGATAQGVASVTLARDCYNVPGRFSMVIQLYTGQGEILVIYSAIGDIQRSSSGRELDSGAPVPSLVELEDAYNAVRAATAAAEAELAGLGQQIGYFGELSARLGAMTVYADLPGMWQSDGTLSDAAGTVHTRLIPVKGYTKIYGRTYMDSYGISVAYFDDAMEYMDVESIPGVDGDGANFCFGNTAATDPLDIPAGAAYVSVSGWGTETDYPILLWGPMVPNAENESFDPGVRSTGAIEHMGVSYVDFGARLDGEHDDTAAVIACHEYANAHGLPVVARDDAVYYIGGRNLSATVRTDVHWGQARFTVDDRNLESIHIIIPKQTGLLRQHIPS